MHEQMAWSTPGYLADELIGFGATGEVWRGRSLRDRAPIALKRLRFSPDAAALAALRRQAISLTGVGQPHLLPIREVVSNAEATVLVLDYAAGGNLAMQLRCRGRLRPGEVVTLLAPLALALACLHGKGLVHRSVHPANVLFTVDGRPLLAEPALPGVASGRSEPDGRPPRPAGPATDVLMLASVAVQALTGRPPFADPDDLATVDAPAPLIRALRRALARDPVERGSAAELALDARSGCEPEPLRLAGRSRGRAGAARVGPAAAHATPAGPRHRWQEPPGRRRPSGRLLAGASVLVAACVGAVWASGSPAGLSAGAAPGVPGPGGTPPGGIAPAVAETAEAPASTAQPASERGWLAVLDRLDAVRSLAYEHGEPELLRQVYLPGAHLAADAAQLGRITAVGDTVRGVRHRLRVVAIVRQGRGRARLRVTQSLPASLRLHSGRATRAIPAGPESTLVVELRLTPAGWRLA
ncbi:MAG: eukaryotic-like serine/threonine-protein kinase [Mycobacteriales bacterium]